jgi:glycyl-radical enzyme activating protein
VHDGPGCRTLIFFKGCTLECPWCCNPEGIAPYPEPLWRRSKCTFDRLCLDACPHDAITIAVDEDGDRLLFDRQLCSECKTRECTCACLSGALSIGGYEATAGEVFAKITRDRSYWGAGGGITLTGGEPFMQPEFAFELLKRCFDAYIHTAVETCGNVPWKNYERSLPFIDWIFYDLKTMDESRPLVHLSSCPPVRPSARRPVRLILANARRLANEFKGRLIWRIPVIPGFNDDMENIEKTARFILSAGRTEINLLPLHHLGREKYRLTGIDYLATDIAIPSQHQLDEIVHQFGSFGIKCYTGSETPF